MIPAAAAEQMGKRLGLDLAGVMIHLLEAASERAIVPISGFRVGAVAAGAAVGEWANLYLGANMEFAGQPLAYCIHAEQSAVNNAWLHGEPTIQSIACTSPPCGLCRQFLTEIGKDLEVITPSGRHLLSSLLPFAFGPADLGRRGGLLDSGSADLELVGPSDDTLLHAALDAASRSYAPYTGALSGCAIETGAGVIAGRVAENAAYNPSLSATQSAFSLSAMSTNPAQIQRIAIVVLSSAPDRELAIAKALSTPNAELTVGLARLRNSP